MRGKLGNAPLPREEGSAGKDDGMPPRTGTGDARACCGVVAAKEGVGNGDSATANVAAVDVDVAPRDEERSEGVVGRLGVDEELDAGGYGERVRRAKDTGGGDEDDDGELVRCTRTGGGGKGDSGGSLRGVSEPAESGGGGGVDGAAVGELRPERVGKSGARSGGGARAGTDSGAGSAAGPDILRVWRGGKLGALVAGTDCLGAGARVGGSGEGTFSGGLGTRSASRINRKSRPNS